MRPSPTRPAPGPPRRAAATHALFLSPVPPRLRAPGVVGLGVALTNSTVEEGRSWRAGSPMRSTELLTTQGDALDFTTALVRATFPPHRTARGPADVWGRDRAWCPPDGNVGPAPSAV